MAPTIDFDDTDFCRSHMHYPPHHAQDPAMSAMMQAIRALRRIYSGPTAQAMAEAADCDAHFDGGEWSGPAHAEMMDDWLQEKLRHVAAAYGLDTATLGRALDRACYEQEGREWDAMAGNRDSDDESKRHGGAW
jgi:hypothetical protein